MVDGEQSTLIRRAAAAIRRPGDVTFSYDHDSDTMLIHFFGEPRLATSVPVDDPNDVFHVLWDRAHDQIVGLQIEGIALDFVFRHPEMADTLAIARLRGLTREEADEIARRAKERGPWVAAVAQNLEGLGVA